MSLIKTYKELPVFKASALATDYTDAHYGKLTIMRPIRRDEVHIYWLAKCECGTQVEVRAHQLQNGVGKLDSCGRCQKLLRYDIAEIPYTLTNDGAAPEQKELPLDDVSASEVAEALGGPTYMDDIVGRVLEVSDPEPTAWDIAGQCCRLIEKLSNAERIKATRLIDVQLGFDL